MLVLSSTNTRQFDVLFLNKELFCFVFSPLPKTIIKSNCPYKCIGCAELLSAVRNRDSDFVRNGQFSSKCRINTGTVYVIYIYLADTAYKNVSLSIARCSSAAAT